MMLRYTACVPRKAGGAGFASVVAAVRMIGCGCEIKCYLVYSLSAGGQAARLLRSRMTTSKPQSTQWNGFLSMHY